VARWHAAPMAMVAWVVVLAASSGCAHLEEHAWVERKVLASSSHEERSATDGYLRLKLDLERSPEGVPLALAGRVGRAEVCRTFEQRRVAETDVRRSQLESSPIPRLAFGSAALLAAIALGGAAGETSPGPRRDTLAAFSVVGGTVALGIAVSLFVDLARTRERRGETRVVEQTILVGESACHPSPGAAIPVRVNLLDFGFKQTDVCTVYETPSDAEGRFRIDLGAAAPCHRSAEPGGVELRLEGERATVSGEVQRAILARARR